jgi:hypothetical protein
VHRLTGRLLYGSFQFLLVMHSFFSWHSRGGIFMAWLGRVS